MNSDIQYLRLGLFIQIIAYLPVSSLGMFQQSIPELISETKPCRNKGGKGQKRVAGKEPGLYFLNHVLLSCDFHLIRSTKCYT